MREFSTDASALRVCEIVHRGQRIVYVDFSAIGDDGELLRTIALAHLTVSRAAPATALIVTDARDLVLNAFRLQALLALVRHDGPFVRASAIVGMAGLRWLGLEIARRVTGRDIRPFDELGDALDWLAAQGAERDASAPGAVARTLAADGLA